jgi:hypothetical protein
LPAATAAASAAESIAAIDYGNFKNSCGAARHDAYIDVWKAWWRAAQSPELAQG